MPDRNSLNLLEILREMADGKGVDAITYGDIASRAGVPWQTVKRHLGPREQFATLLESRNERPNPDARVRILQAAAKVFAEKGYEASSLDNVAAEAGLTKGAIYWHFRNKADLFFALLDSRFKSSVVDLPLQVEQAIQHPDRQQGLTELVSAQWAQCIQAADWPALFLEFVGQTRDESVREHIAQTYGEIYLLSSKLLAVLKKGGLTAADADSEALSVMWTALFDGLMIAQLVQRERLDVARLLPKIVNMIWHGIAPSGSSCAIGLEQDERKQ
ncbi:TetR/AcrR family transcriptional regulator [Chitinivorax sp. B]|uniref:TetR/AcrR family transcriptional regulator n=1 Tax=Chitinivorax sp. B TaxID=2502235 RepID=UPI0014858290|nr:TetR/AcrR family transcriptional regulator [Chitinivorax sp. B]